MQKTEKLKAQLAMLDNGEVAAAAGRRHVVFKDSDEEARAFNAAEHFKTAPELVKQAHNRLKLAQLAEGDVVVNKLAPGQLAAAEKAKEAAYRELLERNEREDVIEQTAKKLRTHRNLMDKGKRVAIVKKDKFGEVIKSKTVYRWKAERK